MASALKAIVSGYMATKAMTYAMYNLTPLLGLPRVDVAGAIDTAGQKSKGDASDNHDAKKKKEQKQPGMFVHYVLGSLIFPLSYQSIFRSLLPGNQFVKGILWGAGLWGIGQTIVFPLLGKGPFFQRKKSAALTYFLVHMIYGVTFCTGTELKKSD